MTKETRQLIRLLRHEGMICRINGSGHWRVFDPRTGRLAVLPSSPGDPRSLANTRSILRRFGMLTTRKRS